MRHLALFSIVTLFAVGCHVSHKHPPDVVIDGPDLPEDPDPCEVDLNEVPTGGEDIVRTNRLQEVLDSIVLNRAILATIDFIEDDHDSYWVVNETEDDGLTEGEALVVVVIELAGFKNHNRFGVYDANNHFNMVMLFDGAAGAEDSVNLAIFEDGEVYLNGESTGVLFSSLRFGFWLDSSYYDPRGGLFFSDSTLNQGGKDYMVAFQGDDESSIDPPGDWEPEVFQLDEFILGFEDLYDNEGLEEEEEFRADWDYEDFVVLISGIRPRLCD